MTNKERKKQLRKLDDKAKDCANNLRKLKDDRSIHADMWVLLDNAYDAFIEASNNIAEALNCVVKV